MQKAPAKRPEASPPVKTSPNKNTDDTPKADPYLSSVSIGYRVAKYITVFLLIVFMLFSFTFMRNDITLENLRYLLKFISFTNTETSITASKINYPSGEPNRLDLFIGDLCSLSPSGYALYDSRGNQIMSEQIRYADPVLKLSERFALCYDLNGAEYTILNTFTKLYNGTSEYPITDADIANDGSFAIASSSREYRTAVTLYDADFKAISRVYKNDHLMALEYKPDGSYIALMTASAQGGSFYTRIELVTPGSDKVLASAEIDGLGYSLYIMDGAISVITDEGIYMFNETLDLMSTSEHASELAMTDASEKYLTVMYSNAVIGNSYRAKIIDVTGRTVYDGEFEGKLVGIDNASDGDYVFILTGTTLSRINLINKKIAQTSVETDAIDVLASDISTVLVAKKNYAVTYDLSALEEHYYDRTSDGADTTKNTEA